MAKGLKKFKSVFKKMQSFKQGHTNSCSDHDSYCSNEDLHPVYVGKSRRRYLVRSDILYHPLFKELVEKSGNSDDSITITCEVVLFQHLLWMLQNADPQPDSFVELVQFYV